MMRWDLIPFWAKEPKIGISTINAKAETVATASSSREAFRKRRCLVPADAKDRTDANSVVESLHDRMPDSSRARLQPLA
jgi:putative SOS response-associated peptidase YedK